MATASALSRSGASTELRYSPRLRMMMTRQLRSLAAVGFFRVGGRGRVGMSNTLPQGSRTPQAGMLPGCFPRPILGSNYAEQRPSSGHSSYETAPEQVSGYHMAVVAAIVFLVLRALFALVPAFGDRHPIKN